MIIRVIDFETTGLPPDNAQPVEVATVDLVEGPSSSAVPGTSVWARGRMWSSLINPGRPIPPETSAVHHITDDMVVEAPPFAAIMENLLLLENPNLAAPELWAAHNSRFEQAVLPGDRRWICTYRAALACWPDAPNHKNQTLRYWLGLKLADPALAHPHRALGDAYVTAALLRRLLAIMTVDELLDISARPALLPRLTFGEHAMKPIADVPMSYLSWIVEKSKGPWDEDVMHTAKHYLAAHRAAERSRSPV